MGRVSKKDEKTIMVIAVLLVVIIAVAIISGNFFSIACPSSQVVPNTGGGGCYTPPTINNVPSPLIINGIAIWGNGNCNDWTGSCFSGFVWGDTNTTIKGVSHYSGWSFCEPTTGQSNFCYGFNGTGKYNIYLGSNKSTGVVANNYNEQTLTVMQNILNYYKYDDCIPYDACYEGETQAILIDGQALSSYPVIIQQLQQAIAYNNNLTTSQLNTTTTSTTLTTTLNTTFTSIPTTPPPPQFSLSQLLNQIVSAISSFLSSIGL